MNWDKTYPAGSSERTNALQDAGNRFDTLYDQQRERLAGFYARLGRGLCWKDLGENEKAFAIFEELLGLPDDPADFHTLAGKGRRAGPGDGAAARGEETTSRGWTSPGGGWAAIIRRLRQPRSGQFPRRSIWPSVSSAARRRWPM